MYAPQILRQDTGRFLWVVWVICAVCAPHCLAATAREDLALLLIEDVQGRPPLFQSTPITHIVPEFNTVTYAVDLHLINTSVEPAYKRNGNVTEILKYSGWSASPYLALSLKKVGIGFNVDAGKKSLEYERYVTDQRRQTSSVDYRGLGIYLFYKPFDSKDIIPSVTLGGKSLTAQHDFGYLLSDAERASAQTKSVKLNYSVYNYSFGLNTQFRLVKSMTVIPWADYVWVDDAAAHTASNKALSDWSRPDFRDDLKIMWHDRPPLNYGLDFSVDMGGFQIRMGGLLGAIVSSGLGTDQVKDQGMQLSFAWNQKG